MLRSQNVTGPTNATTSGYNSSVNSINLMQKQEQQELEQELASESAYRSSFLAAYENFRYQQYYVSVDINQIDGLIKEF